MIAGRAVGGEFPGFFGQQTFIFSYGDSEYQVVVEIYKNAFFYDRTPHAGVTANARKAGRSC